MSMQPHTEFVPALQLTSLAAVRLAPNPGPMSLEGTNSYILRGAGQRARGGRGSGARPRGPPGRAGRRVRGPDPRSPTGTTTTPRASTPCIASPAPRSARSCPNIAARRSRCATANGSRPPDCGSRCLPPPATPPTRCASSCPTTAPAVPCSPATPSWAAAPPSWMHPTARWATTWAPWTGWPRRPMRWCCPRTARCWSRCTGSLPTTAPIAWSGSDQIRAALAELRASGVDQPGIAQVADIVYADVDPSVRGAAEISVAAQLHYLGDLGEY